MRAIHTEFIFISMKFTNTFSLRTQDYIMIVELPMHVNLKVRTMVTERKMDHFEQLWHIIAETRSNVIK